MKKFIFSFILILLCLFSVTAYAESEIFNYSFEAEEEQDSWYGAFFDRTIIHGNAFSAYITNPFGQEKNNTITHVMDYTGKVHIEEGKFYTLSGYVMNPLNDYNQEVHTDSYLEDGANTIIITVSGANAQWQLFNTTFYAGTTGDFNLSIRFTEGNVDFGFFIDELNFKEIHYTLSKIEIEGASEIMIPINTVSTAIYNPTLIASDSTRISILSNSSIVSSCTHSEGITYNPTNFMMSVTNEAVPGTQLTIDFALRNYKEIAPTSYTVILTDNMIEDPSFDNNTLLWESTSRITIETTDTESYIRVPTNDYGTYGYYATITYTAPQFLIGGELYVLRAKVKSDSVISDRTIYAKNKATLIDNTVFFEIRDISGNDWSEVFTAFIPEDDGIYDVSVNLFSVYDCNIFVDDITITAEKPKPEYITLHAPGNIAVPDVTTAYPVSAILRDQLGNIIDNSSINISLVSDNTSLQYDNNEGILIIFPDTVQGNYALTATYVDNPELTATLPFKVSFDYIGDGTFETTVPNEWWTVASPFKCDLYFRNDGFSKRALVNSDGEYFILLNNSYVHLIENVPYVFNSEFSCNVNCTVTLFIEALDSSVHPLAQFYLPAGTTLGEKLIPELFLAEENVVGRPFLYIQSDVTGPFSIYVDNLSLKKATILATAPYFTGETKVNGAAEAQFSFYNSVTQDSDTSSCIVNWYVSPDISGPYTMLENYGTNIYFDITYYNKYVYFEVIPVCPVTGFSGDTIKSPIVKITMEDPDAKTPSFSLPQLSPYTGKEIFNDTNGHWAVEYIETLAGNGIINGRGDGRFYPDDYITRAEFSKILCSSFSSKVTADISQFTDISPADWFYNEVCMLNQNGIINGITPETFAPLNRITRQDAVVMIMRMCELFCPDLPVADLIFPDNENISGYSYPYLQSACALGIINGNTDGYLLPKDNITRAEASAIILRMINSI